MKMAEIEWKQQGKWKTGCSLLRAGPERDHEDHEGRQDDLVGQDQLGGRRKYYKDIDFFKK